MLARRLKVKFFVMENVPAVMDQELFVDELAIIKRSYNLWYGPLNAALHGLPQTRQRCIVIGYHRDFDVEPVAPRITHLGSQAVFDYQSGRRLVPSEATADAILGPYPRIGFAKKSASARWFPDDVSDLEDLVTVGAAIGDLPQEGCEDGETLRSSKGLSEVRAATPRSRTKRSTTIDHGGTRRRPYRRWPAWPRAVRSAQGVRTLTTRRRTRDFIGMACPELLLLTFTMPVADVSPTTRRTGL